MTLVLVAANPAPAPAPSAQWAHDIRNALAVASLHLETLERLSGAAGRKAASAAQATLTRATGLCNASLTDKAPGAGPRRTSFDLMPILREIAAVLGGVAPAPFAVRVPAETRCMVVGSPTDLYRTVFNLVQNAVTAARRGAVMSEVRIDIVRDDMTVIVTVADDGPGLPATVRRSLFRRQARSASGGSGFGIAIARELAERNGARLTLDESVGGTCYRLELMGLRGARALAAAM